MSQNTLAGNNRSIVAAVVLVLTILLLILGLRSRRTR